MLQESLQKFISQTEKVLEAQKSLLVGISEYGQLVKGVTGEDTVGGERCQAARCQPEGSRMVQT